MSLLSERFREKVSKHKDFRQKSEAQSSIGYPTGFLSFDFRNGNIVHVKTDKLDYSYYSVGIVDGSLNTLIGRSSCGKTTFAVQAASNIVRPFSKSCVFYDNLEGGIIESRLEALSGFYGNELKERFVVRDTGVTAENFFERIKMIHDMKLESKEEYQYDTGLLNSRGEKIYKLEPTCYILDSLAMLMPEKYADEDELSGQMSSTAAAKANSSIFKRIGPMLKIANIILFVINHINEDIAINQYAQKATQVSYLKQGEALPGGKKPVYLSNNLIRFTDRVKIIEDKDTVYKFDGSLVELSLLKSRTNKAGQGVTLVLNFNIGFDPEWSLFTFLKEAGAINGAGAHFYIGDRTDIKFPQKNFKEKILNDPELYSVMIQEASKYLKELVYVPTEDEDSNNFTNKLYSDVMKSLNVNK